MKRPFGITICALLLGWLAIAGFGNGWIILSGQISELPKSIGLIAFFYGITALSSTIGLWRMKPWGIIAVRSWMAVCLLFLIVFTILFNKLILGGYLGSFGFLIFTGSLFWLLDRYVKSKIAAAI